VFEQVTPPFPPSRISISSNRLFLNGTMATRNFLSVEVYTQILVRFAQVANKMFAATSSVQALKAFSMPDDQVPDGYVVEVVDAPPQVFEDHVGKLMLFFSPTGLPPKRRVKRKVPWNSPRGFQALRDDLHNISSSYRKRKDNMYSYHIYRKEIALADHMDAGDKPAVFLMHVSQTADSPKRGRVNAVSSSGRKKRSSRSKRPPKHLVPRRSPSPSPLPAAQPQAQQASGRSQPPSPSAPAPLCLSDIPMLMSFLEDTPSSSSSSSTLPGAPPLSPSLYVPPIGSLFGGDCTRMLDLSASGSNLDASSMLGFPKTVGKLMGNESSSSLPPLSPRSLFTSLSPLMKEKKSVTFKRPAPRRPTVVTTAFPPLSPSATLAFGFPSTGASGPAGTSSAMPVMPVESPLAYSLSGRSW